MLSGLADNTHTNTHPLQCHLVVRGVRPPGPQGVKAGTAALLAVSDCCVRLESASPTEEGS